MSDDAVKFPPGALAMTLAYVCLVRQLQEQSTFKVGPLIKEIEAARGELKSAATQADADLLKILEGVLRSNLGAQ